MNKIRVGIVGAGYIANFHARGLKECPETEISAIADQNIEKAKTFAGEYSIAKYYRTLEEMLRDDAADAVIISTPNAFHAPYVTAALEKGLHTFVEKPMAVDIDGALKMKTAAEKNRKVLMVGHMWRFDREVRYLANLVSSGKIGEIFKTTGYGIHVNWGPSGWFTDSKLAGGGSLADMGIHAIDTVRYILGDPVPVKVYAKTGTYIKDFDVDDTATLMITWDNGATSIIESGWWHPHMDGPEAGTKLYGTKGYASLYPTQVKTVVDGKEDVFTPDFPERKEHCDQHMYTGQMQEFVRVIREEAPVSPGAEEGLINVRIVEAAYRSSLTGEAVSL